MQRLLAQLAQATGTGRARRRTRDAEEEDESGMARAVFDENLPAVSALLLRGVDAAAVDRCVRSAGARLRRRMWLTLPRSRSGQRPLLLALLRNDRADVAELLLAAGADPCGEDGHGLTPLHWLAQRRADADVLTPLVALLRRCGADLEAREKLYGAPPRCALLPLGC